MTRQLEQATELRRESQVKKLHSVLDFELAGAIEFQGMRLLGVAITYDPFYVRVVLKAECEGKRLVAFVSSDTMVNALIQAQSAAARNTLHWAIDKYFTEDV